MKKSIKIAVAVLAIMFCMSSAVAFASTSYDTILSSETWNSWVNHSKKNISTNAVLKNYLDLLITEQDLDNLVKSGYLGKEKSKFVSENKSDFLYYMHCWITVWLSNNVPSGNIDDFQVVLITSIITNPKAKETIGFEVWRQDPLYVFWESIHKDGVLSVIVVEEIGILKDTAVASTKVGSTKYDIILSSETWNKLINASKNLSSEPIIKNYLDLLVNEQDLDELIKSGSLDKEKSKFVSENKSDFLKYTHLDIFIFINDNMSDVKEYQIELITNVIMDPRAMAATNYGEYQIEKEFWRESPVYKLWEVWHSDGFLAMVVNAEIDLLYEKAKAE
jgi:hypothetical protein